jgi:hypothetical protein
MIRLLTDFWVNMSGYDLVAVILRVDCSFPWSPSLICHVYKSSTCLLCSFTAPNILCNTPICQQSMEYTQRAYLKTYCAGRVTSFVPRPELPDAICKLSDVI